MLKVFIIGSNRFDGLKGVIHKTLKSIKGVSVLAVGFDEVYQYPLKRGDYETLRRLENKSIEDADLIIHVDNDKIDGEKYTGKDTFRELVFAKLLNKTIVDSDQLFENYLKIFKQGQ